MNEKTPEKLNGSLSETIAFLRFPLIVMIVVLHSTIAPSYLETAGEPGAFPVYDTLSKLLSGVFGNLGVPIFFVISGFLFFYKTDFTRAAYGRKLKSRVRSLLVPYLIWNTAYFAVFVLLKSVPATSAMISSHPILEQLNPMGIVYNLWGLHDIPAVSLSVPIVGPMWFIRDLMVTCVCSPLIWLAVKYLRVFAVVLLGVAWYLFPGLYCAGFGITAFFFFTAGAWFSINRRDIVEQCGQVFTPSMVLFPILAIAEVAANGYGCYPYIHKVGIVVGIVFVFNVASRLLATGKVRPNAFLASASFFVFAFHEPTFFYTRLLLLRTILPATDFGITLFYLLSPVVMIAVSLALYALLKRYLPRFTAIITGGR